MVIHHLKLNRWTKRNLINVSYSSKYIGKIHYIDFNTFYFDTKTKRLYEKFHPETASDVFEDWGDIEKVMDSHTLKRLTKKEAHKLLITMISNKISFEYQEMVLEGYLDFLKEYKIKQPLIEKQNNILLSKKKQLKGKLLNKCRKGF